MAETIQFKGFDKSDLKAFEQSLEKFWSYEEYTDNEVIRKAFVKTDVYMALYESDYKETVYVNGEFAGIALGRINAFKAAILNIGNYFNFMRYALKLKFHSKEARKILKNFKNMYKEYKKLLKEKKKHLKSELILFLVDSEFHRRGLGKALITRFEETLINKKKTHYYLFTDTTCVFGFYDANGFQKENERTMTEPLKDGSRELTIMLYSKTLKGGD